MSDPFDLADAPTAAAEGGYVFDERDAGGATNFGITEAVARSAGFTASMRDMTADQAKAIRRKLYWDAPGLGNVAGLSQRLATELYDAGINMGAGTAGTFLQRALNVLNRQARDYPDLPVTGNIGPITVGALRTYLTARGKTGEMVLLKAVICLRGARYVELAEKREANEAFVFGWIANRIAIPT